MMFKLSFMALPAIPCKEVTKGERTAVSLMGTFTFPMQMSVLPQDIIDWMFNAECAIRTAAEDRVVIEATGYAHLHPEDTYDPVLGERIAEARAKIKLYKFMLTLVSKIFRHFTILQYGRLGTHTVQFHDINPNEECLHNTIMRYAELIRKEYEHLNELVK